MKDHSLYLTHLSNWTYMLILYCRSLPSSFVWELFWPLETLFGRVSLAETSRFFCPGISFRAVLFSLASSPSGPTSSSSTPLCPSHCMSGKETKASDLFIFFVNGYVSTLTSVFSQSLKHGIISQQWIATFFRQRTYHYTVQQNVWSVLNTLSVWRFCGSATATSLTGTRRCTTVRRTPQLKLVQPPWTRSWAKWSSSSLTRPEPSPRTSWSSASAPSMDRHMVGSFMKVFSKKWYYNVKDAVWRI